MPNYNSVDYRIEDNTKYKKDKVLLCELWQNINNYLSTKGITERSMPYESDRGVSARDFVIRKLPEGYEYQVMPGVHGTFYFSLQMRK